MSSNGVTVITINMPPGYEVCKWKYENRTGKHTAYAVMYMGKAVFGQNKTFASLTAARKAIKSHTDTERTKARIRAEREHFEKYGTDSAR